MEMRKLLLEAALRETGYTYIPYWHNSAGIEQEINDCIFKGYLEANAWGNVLYTTEKGVAWLNEYRKTGKDIQIDANLQSIYEAMYG